MLIQNLAISPDMQYFENKTSLRVTEMAKVIEQVKISGDTHGVWKYDGSKVMEHEIPGSIKRAAAHEMSDVEFSSKSGFYKTDAAQSSQGGSRLAPTP
ncbi:hypothetical protein Lsan_0117 [Legionella santicrucis]|uniref:Uncharacterized protein n=1 Tax=Legionella santicrucis TaxID=45074 RepID=A0A0W0ZKJ3_9GAMM|nr:hypothetical protein [Legionella santicrucis]KTD69839.1 hypothetical protein Lsan_0117 [Legionella santicrucis]